MESPIRQVEYHGKSLDMIISQSLKQSLLEILQKRFQLPWNGRTQWKVGPPKSPGQIRYPVILLLNIHEQLEGPACVLIERRAKEGHTQPRMFVIPRMCFDEALFADTVSTGDLLWDSEGHPSLVLQELVADRGVPMKSSSARGLKALGRLLEAMYDHVPGYSFMQVVLGDLVGAPSQTEPLLVYTAQDKDFIIKSTDLPDVIEVFRDGGAEFLGYATVASMRDSLWLGQALREQPAGVRLRCEWSAKWKAWQPIIPVSQ